MKKTSCGTFRWRVIAVIFLAYATALFGAVNLTVTPSSISNTYNGPITLDITDLNSGEQVTIDEFLDLNGNGVVDSGELMLNAIKITDGGVSTIGGVTNINVPFDSNAAAGDITTTPLKSSVSFENIVGKHILRVVSPTGRFTPVTATLNVTNAALSQSIAGVVYKSGIPAPGAVAVALKLPNTSFAGGAIANNSGQYTLSLPPGPYVLFAVVTNSFVDVNAAPQVTLTNGSLMNADLYVANATVTISGRIYDVGNSNGLGGAFVQLENENNGYNAFAFADTNGDYTAGATSDNNWKAKVDGTQLALRAFVVLQNKLHVDASGGSVTDANISVYKANALYYGRVVDASSNGIPNLDVYAQDSAGLFESDGITDSNGNYVVAVRATNATWNCSLSGDAPELAGFIASSGNFTSVSAGQAVSQNFVLLPTTAQISGQVHDNSGNPISGVSVSASASINGSMFNTAQVDTDGGGNYSFGAASGNWSVNVNCCGGNGLDSRGLYDPFTHSIAIPPTNAVVNITVYAAGTPFLSQPSRFGSSAFGFGLAGSFGSNYTIEVSTNLSLNDWTTVLVTNLPGNFIYFQDNQATGRQRFYRVLLGP